MDFQPSYQSDKLYGCLCEPEEMLCWKALPLKSGVYIITLLDIILGSIYCLGFIDMIRTSFAYYSGVSIALLVLETLLSMTAIPFAIMGFLGIRNLQQPRLHFYTQFKQVELPLVLVLTLLHGLFTCGSDEFGCDKANIIGYFILRGGYNLYFLHVVWSADQRLQHNETVLVMHGKDVLLLMRQQAKALEPRTFVVAEPGQALSQAPIGVVVQPISSS